MIKTIVKNRVKFILGSAALFLISYILGIQLVIPLFLLVIFIYLKSSFKDLNLKKHNLLNLALLYVIILFLGYMIIREGSRYGWSVYHIPFSAMIMLSMILFGKLEISLLFTLASAITIASLANNSFSLCLLFIVSGIASSILVFGARKRSSIIFAGFMIGFIQASLLLFITGFKVQSQNSYLVLIFNGVASSIIALGILPIFEYLFKTVTNVSLLELADFNQPLLQRLTLEAPGTYHHSIVVGNLSEAACRTVGANALLARIGAYYHDIGKLQKPEYFSENQPLELSKHDALAPTMSKMVIMNHVKEGVELVKKYKLNPFLNDFVSQHHGTSLVYYFYRRALENQDDRKEIVEEGFRYPGPKPRTKETAIVLLADSVEAATRTLKDPSPANIEDLVHKVMNNKFIDGQLDECDLTLKDLEKISQTFLRILTGIYHSRITYPEKLESANFNHKKSSKEDSHPSAEDKKSSS